MATTRDETPDRTQAREALLRDALERPGVAAAATVAAAIRMPQGFTRPVSKGVYALGGNS